MGGDLSFNPARSGELVSFGTVGRNSSTGAPAAGYVPLTAGGLESADTLALSGGNLLAGAPLSTPENTDVPLVVQTAVTADPTGATLNPDVRAVLVAAPETFPAA